MAYGFDDSGWLYWSLLEPEEYIRVYTSNVTFVLEHDVSVGCLKVVEYHIDKPTTYIADHIKKNRNLQEVMCGTDIELDEMELYVRTIGDRLPKRGMPLYAKAPCAGWNQGEKVHSAYVTKIEPLPVYEPEDAPDTLQESA